MPRFDGSENAEQIDGSWEPDEIYGGDGDDLLYGYEADDSLYGDDGDDSVGGDEGNDTLSGGTGNDTLVGGADNDSLSGDEGNDSLLGGVGSDTLSGGVGEDNLDGGEESDELDGGEGNDFLSGGTGDDTVMGGSGSDTVEGGEGADVMQGGAGADTLISSDDGASDTISGGDDADYIFAAMSDVVDGGSGGDDNDTLDLTGMGPYRIVNETEDADGNSTSGQIEFLNEDGTVRGTMTFTEIERFAACFTKGTQIQTAEGLCSIEDLQVGDLVQTLDNGLQPIRWIGSTVLPAIGNRAPIQFAAGTLGNSSDTMVSPMHRVLLTGPQAELMFGQDEVLVTAASLVNDTTIRRVSGGMVTYIHILFDSHEIVFGDGMASESFYPGGMALGAMAEATRQEIYDLFPELCENQYDAFGHTARMCLKAHEARALAASLFRSEPDDEGCLLSN